MECFLGTILPIGFNWAPQDYNLCDGTVAQIAQYNALYSLLGVAYGGDASKTFGLPDLRGRLPMGQGLYSGTTGTVNYLAGQKAGSSNISVGGVLSTANMPAHTHAATFAATTGPQNINLPKTTASGTITSSGTIGLVPGVTQASGTASPVAGQSYNLAGFTGTNIQKGPFTQTAIPTPAANAASIPVTTTVDLSAYNAGTAAQTVSATMVTGGTVTNAATGSGAAFTATGSGSGATLPPYQVVNFIIALVGVYPMRP